MTRTLVAALAAASTLAACANPPPRCAPRGDTYTICSDQDVWECPTGPADVVAFNKSLDEQCNQQADPVKCVLDADYNLYMDEQQRINLELMRELAARGVEFALPSRMVHMAPSPAARV